MSERRSYPWYFAGLLILGFLPCIALLSAGVAPAVNPTALNAATVAAVEKRSFASP